MSHWRVTEVQAMFRYDWLRGTYEFVWMLAIHVRRN